ncbi:hydrogenase expression/formation protein HypE [Candidatus Gracilibacteria bacterium]|nr:hydrogenase expression/formation protein HypE [Candidatus Gracilibacteria bacterium]
MSGISLDFGNGGVEMQSFLQTFLPKFYRGEKWGNFENDAATFPIHDGKTLCFTTDSFVVDPILFPGGNIGDLAFAGTVNDLVVMGADPIGLSCALILEEGLDEKILEEVLKSLANLSDKFQIPIVTGDTKVMEKGSIDGIVINTSGIGIAEKILDDSIEVGDKILISGGIGEHGVALLSKRFDFQTEVVSDSKPLVSEMKEIRSLIKWAKDPTRGGVAASLNEAAVEKNLELEIWDQVLPIQKAVRIAGDLLGIDILTLANEGKILCIVKAGKSEAVLEKLKKYNSMAAIIGEVKKEKINGQVILKTVLGARIMSMPSGKIVPRIC